MTTTGCPRINATYQFVEIAVSFVLVNLMYMKEKMVIGAQQSARKTKKICRLWQMQIQTKSQILRRVGPAKKSDECRVDEARLSSLDGRKDRARKRLLIKQTKIQQHRIMNAGLLGI